MLFAISVLATLTTAISHPSFGKLLPHGGKPKHVFENGDIVHAEGVVVTISDESIVLAVPGEKVPRQYPAYYHLRMGKPRPGVSEGWGYRMSDVRIGDLVCLGIHRENKQDFCVQINISVRPNGLVPPSPVVDPELKKRYHVMRNESIANQRFGIPIPKK